MDETLVTTSEAASLCSVTPDAVLKWIKGKKIEAIKTPGGHYRIKKEKLRPFIGTDDLLLENTEPEKKLKIQYCWEFHAKNGQLNQECNDCMVYKSKTEKCFLMAGYGKNAGHAGIFCTNTCYECEYFRYVNKSAFNILIITKDQKIKNALQLEIEDDTILRFSQFRPDFIVLDEDFLGTGSDDICNHLINDTRIKGTQIILAITKKRRPGRLPKGICCSIRAPFSASKMKSFLQSFQMNCALNESKG
jgi:excisionase family DNA binding protein